MHESVFNENACDKGEPQNSLWTMDRDNVYCRLLGSAATNKTLKKKVTCACDIKIATM